MRMVKESLATAVIVGMVAVATSTYAIPTLFLSDGVGDTVEIAENSPLNLDSSVPGAVAWTGSVGVWNLNVSTGVSSGTGTSPNFDLNSIDAIIPATSPVLVQRLPPHIPCMCGSAMSVSARPAVTFSRRLVEQPLARSRITRMRMILATTHCFHNIWA